MMTLAARVAQHDRALARAWLRLLEQAPFQARLVDCYVSGEPYLSLNALVLTPTEAVELARLAAVFARIFAKATAAIAEDAGLVQAMGFPWPCVTLLQDEPPQPVLLGRLDFGLDRDGRWQLFEFNSDTPSGIREASAAERLIHRSVGAGTRRLTRGLERRLAVAVERHLRGFVQRTGRRVENVGVVTQASYQEDLAQAAFLCDLLEAYWTRYGIPRRAVLGDLGNLWAEDGDLWLLGQRLDALYRLYPYEGLYGHSLFAPLCEAVAEGRLCLLNGLRGFLPQSKAVMAWIWQERTSRWFTPQEQAAIAAHLPPTYRLEDTLGAAPRSGWVVKEFWGREGEEVYLGAEMSDEDWERCRAWGTFVAQQRVATQEVVGLRLEGDRAVPEPAWASVGAFVVDGRFAGCYSRVGSSAIIDAQASFLATLAGKDERSSR
ncbi:MAG: glutathionylspermidine synthase family protein [Chloroflexi bacterium]|nr:glutathionylspermidine synthase family protein [Chloroflexota bacterium]